MHFENGFWNKHFSHIYVEEEVIEHPKTKAILSFFPHAETIPIKNYKEVFNRSRQSRHLQAYSRSLILAEKKDGFLYPGSVLCHHFNEAWFYYCTNVLNCIYDCSYCWLKGMYNSANLVIFVNSEDYFVKTKEVLREHPLYLSLSYENDLVPLERFTHFLHEWATFAMEEEGLEIEIRTKCADQQIWVELPSSERIIPAFTLSPDRLIKNAEHGTPFFSERLQAVKSAANHGFRPRLCLDPVLFCSGWEEDYAEMIRQIFSVLTKEEIRDVSVGTFRLSKDYMKNIRKAFPNEPFVQYPYTLKAGYYGYEEEKVRHIEETICAELMKYIDAEQIWRLEEVNE